MNDHLVCTLCKGYYRDAHTVQECLHTFCKKCIYLHARNSGNHKCPSCGDVSLGNNMQNVRADHTLQSLVGKLFPMYGPGEDSKAEVLFYEAKGIKRKAVVPRAPQLQKKNVSPLAPQVPSNNTTNNNNNSSSSSSSSSSNSNSSAKRQKNNPPPPPSSNDKPEDIPFQLVPDKTASKNDILGKYKSEESGASRIWKHCS